MKQSKEPKDYGLIIDVIVTPSWYYIKGSRNIDTLLINGAKALPTNHSGWLKVKEKPTKVETIKASVNINYRYAIKDKSFVNETIKEIFPREEVAYYDDELYTWEFKNEYKMYQSLYELEWDKSEPEIQDVVFTLNELFVLEKDLDINNLSYEVQATSYKHQGFTEIKNNKIQHQDLDKIIFPAPLLQLTPCKLSSEDSYRIIRRYVETHINPQVAEIKSNYDFCFTVNKRIKLADAEPYTIDVNNDIFSKRKRKPKMVTRFRTERNIEVFSMTHQQKGYQNYDILKGFSADNEELLKEKIDKYLSELIELINRPIVDCPHCKGHGVVIDENFDLNKHDKK